MQQAPVASKVKFALEPDDLELLLAYSREVGAEEARTVRVQDLSFKESKRRKCEVPNCASYLTNLHCPPKTPDAKRIASCVPHSYEQAILVVMYSPEQELAFPNQLRGGGVWSTKTDLLVEKIESKALSLGYYKAMGFSCGPCGQCGMWTQKWITRVLAREDVRKCNVMDGGICRRHRRSRPASEACGIAIIEFIREVGLAPRHLIFPEVSAKAVPKAPWYGFILVG
jgi:predicted metal-binding protein